LSTQFENAILISSSLALKEPVSWRYLLKTSAKFCHRGIGNSNQAAFWIRSVSGSNGGEKIEFSQLDISIPQCLDVLDQA
jgi:hypothetical protein